MSKCLPFVYKFLSHCLCLLLLAGCASTTQFKPVETKGVEQLLLKGKNQLLSKKKHSEVSLYLMSPETKDGSELDVWIECVNLSKKTAYIDKEKIKVTRLSDKKPLYVLSYEELLEQVKAKNMWNALAIIAGTSYIHYKLSDSVLRPTHIRPKEKFSAIFVATLPKIENKKEQFKIEVDFAGDIHAFQIEQEKQKRKVRGYKRYKKYKRKKKSATNKKK